MQGFREPQSQWAPEVRGRETRGKDECRRVGFRTAPGTALGGPLKRLRATPERAKWVLRVLIESNSDQQRYRATELRRPRLARAARPSRPESA